MAYDCVCLLWAPKGLDFRMSTHECMYFADDQMTTLRIVNKGYVKYVHVYIHILEKSDHLTAKPNTFTMCTVQVHRGQR
jgi:hypothetical protein